MLRAHLYDMEREKIMQARSSDRKKQIGTGDRSEHMRTYNFPQGRVTDHHINLALYKIDLHNISIIMINVITLIVRIITLC